MDEEGFMTSEMHGLAGTLRDFIARHPSGWSHQDWLQLLEDLSRKGADTSNPDRIGADLERERLRVVLEGLSLKGLGPKRRDALASHFGSLWALKQASLDEVAGLPSFHRGLAKALEEALRQRR
jgi:hypothetical protein